MLRTRESQLKIDAKKATEKYLKEELDRLAVNFSDYHGGASIGSWATQPSMATSYPDRMASTTVVTRVRTIMGKLRNQRVISFFARDGKPVEILHHGRCREDRPRLLQHFPVPVAP